MSRLSIGTDLAVRLAAAETAIDHALQETATLAAALPSARVRARLSAVTAQGAFDHTAAALSALTEARSGLVGTHNTLAALGRRLGLDIQAGGPVTKPDETLPLSMEPAEPVGVRLVSGG